MNDAPSYGQVACSPFRWIQPRADQETREDQQDGHECGANSHAIGETYTPIEQVVQHDGMYNRSEGGTTGDDAHCERTTPVEIMGHYCHGWDIHKSLSQPEADPLRKEDLMFQVNHISGRMSWGWENEPDNIYLVGRVRA